MRRALLAFYLILAAGCGADPRVLEPRLVQIDGGDRHACGVDRDGHTWCWGDGGWGQLGAGDSASRPAPVRVAGGLRFTQVSAGYARTCGVDREGGAWCWGEHAAAPAGPGLKALTETTRAEPTRVEGAPPFVAVAAGGFHACGLDAGGRAWCWGSNLFGELGSGSHAQSFTPVAVAGPRFTAIVAGRTHACGLDPDGAAWCWGDNQFGQMGDGGHYSRIAPAAVAGGHRFRALTAGFGHTCGLTDDGRALCWGLDAASQLGAAATATCGPNRCAIEPVAVVSRRRFRSIDAGPRHTCGVTDAGTAWCWGEGWTHERGDTEAREPVEAAEDLEITTVAAAGAETCGITRLGEIRCFSGKGHPARFWPLIALAGGLVIAVFLVAWERRLLPTAIMIIPVSAMIAAWIAIMVPLLRFWNELRKDESDVGAVFELVMATLILLMITALSSLLAMIARAWRKRRTM